MQRDAIDASRRGFVPYYICLYLGLYGLFLVYCVLEINVATAHIYTHRERGNLKKQIIMILCVVSNSEEIFIFLFSFFFWLNRNRNRPSVKFMTMHKREKVKKGCACALCTPWIGRFEMVALLYSITKKNKIGRLLLLLLFVCVRHVRACACVRVCVLALSILCTRFNRVIVLHESKLEC